jgi:uncharacterized membrane protein HdeD (DUF308 family)
MGVESAVSDRAVNELWWIGVLESALALFFGVSAIFWPGLTLVTLVYLFSGFVLGIGVIELIAGLMSIKRRSTWWVTALIGGVGVGLGVYLVRNPNVSFEVFVILIGLFLIARGILDIMRVFVDRMSGVIKTLSAVVGIAAIIAGIFVLSQPVAGGVAFVWVLGLYAIIWGTLGMAISVELRALLTDEARERVDRADETADRNGRTERTIRPGRRTSGAQPV